MKAATPGLLFLLAGCATVPGPASLPERPAEYQCQGDWQTPDSRFVTTALLAEDGRIKSWHLTRLRLSPDRRVVGWVMQFDFEGPRLPAPEEDWSLSLRMDGYWRGSRTVRVDLLRGADVVALSAPPGRAGTLVAASWGRNAVRAAFAGAPELMVRVTDRRGRTLLSHRIPAAVLDSPEEAVAARRAELEAMVADYRNRCDFVPAGSEIVIT